MERNFFLQISEIFPNKDAYKKMLFNPMFFTSKITGTTIPFDTAFKSALVMQRYWREKKFLKTCASTKELLESLQKYAKTLACNQKKHQGITQFIYYFYSEMDIQPLQDRELSFEIYTRFILGRCEDNPLVQKICSKALQIQ